MLLVGTIKFNMSFSWNYDSYSSVNNPLLFAVRVSRPGGKAISFATWNTIIKLFFISERSLELWIIFASDFFKYYEY